MGYTMNLNFKLLLITTVMIKSTFVWRKNYSYATVQARKQVSSLTVRQTLPQSVS